jgi:hypothetical protein
MHDDHREGGMDARAGNNKEILAGLLFIAVGIGYATTAYSQLTIGTADNMGPGYFPLLLASALVVIGVIVALKGLREAPQIFGRIPWRGVILVSAAPVLFALTLPGLGFVPATFFTTFTATLASREATLKRSFVTSAIVTVISIAVFVYGFGVQAPLIGVWLGGNA